MLPLVLTVFLLAGPALPTPSTSTELEVRGQRTPRDTKQDSIKVVISEGCATQGDSSDVNQAGKEIDLAPGSPLVLTHKIKLVTSGPGSGSGSCGCEADSAALRERLERLEREMSVLLEKCGGPEGSCCTSKESKGAGCSIKPDGAECPNECSDQGRCVDGRCVCFPGFSGPDCSHSNCPGNCNDRGRCVNGQCVCDPGFTGPDCSQAGCPDDCNDRGRCVNGQCVCDPGFTGPDCSQAGCPDDCNDRGRCVNGQCVCDPGFTGPGCSDQSCPGNCNRRGRCVNGQCVCDPGFMGPDCSPGGCPDDCNDRGRCVNGRCVCDGGFTGPSCSDESCPGNCNRRGRCVNGQCVCDVGFAGPDCSQRACPNNCNDRGRCVNGKCVCDSGFTGADCSEVACPGNCNNRGRCVGGQCVCDDGFTGDGCLERSCPDDCNNRGRCIDGRCVCDSGFTGDDCSEVTCPGNCNSRGRCVNGQCVCDNGFTGADCSEKACPNNCSNRGKCVNGKCVCAVGFAGPDCAAKGCPNNCSNKGRCVRGSCVCRRGFTGPDCSQCQEGMTGPNCDTAMSGVSQLRTQDITESSVTLVWSPPPVQYETYYITFSSQKESDQQVVAQVSGDLTTFTQTGLAAGQEYRVVIVGEADGRRGTESVAEFMTLISGPANLHVVKTTSTSAVVQWEQSQGEIDRYRLTITPNDGVGRSQDLTIPAAENSAHIRQLEAGRLYDIVLVAEKGASRSEPATAQAVPGETLPKVTTAALTMQVTLAPGQDVSDDDRDSSPLSPELRVFDHQGRREDANSRGLDDPNRSSSASVIARTKPVVSKVVALNGTRPKVAGRPMLSRKVPGPWHYNTTRVVPGRRKFVPGPLKKDPVVAKKKEQTVPRKPNPGAPIIGDSEQRDDKGPAVMSGTDSETNGQSGSEEPTAAVGTKEQPDVGRLDRGNDTDPVPPEPTGSVQSQEKKCMNKIKVTHFRLPQRDGGRGCRGDGTVLAGNTLSSDPDTPPSAETDLDYSPDPLHKLLTDTFDSLNITTFSVHLSKPSDLGAEDAETVRKLILRKLKPVSSSSSLYSSTSDSFSTSESLPSLVSSASTAAPLSSHASRSSSPPSPPSSPTFISEVSDPLGRSELNVDNSKSTTDSPPLPEDRKPSGGGTRPLFQHTLPKRGYVRRPHPYLLQNKTQLNRVPHRPPSPRLNLIPKREPETEQPSTSELSSHSSEESSSEEVNIQVKDTGGDKDGTTAPASSSEVEHNQKMTPIERGRIPSRRPLPKGGYLRRPFQNTGPFQNRTRPNMRPLTRPITHPLTDSSQLLDAEMGTQKEPVISTAFPATSSPSIVKDSHPSDTRPEEEENEGRIETRISTASSPTEFNQTVRGGEAPSSRRPNTKVGYFRRPQGFRRSFTNRTRTNQIPPPHRGPVRKPFPMRKLNTGSGLTVGSQTSHSGRDGTNQNSQNSQNQLGKQDVHRPRQEVVISRGLTVGSQTSHLGKDGTNENPEIQLGEQDVHRPRQGVLISRGLSIGSQTSHPESDGTNENPEIQLGEQDVQTLTQKVLIRQSGEQEITKVSPVGSSTTVRPETNDLGNGDNALIQKEETNPTGSDTHTEIIDPGKNTGTALRDKPTLKQSSSYSRASRPATPPKRHSQTRTLTAQQHSTNMRQYNGGGQREQDPKRNHTAERVFFTKTEQTGGPATDASSSGVTREPLDFVGVTNRTSDGFTLVWDSPEGKYKNFVVTRNKVGKDEVPKQKEQVKELEQDKEGGSENGHAKHQPTKKTETERGTDEDDNRLPESLVTQVPKSRSSVIAKPSEGDSTFKKLLPGSARSFQFEDLPPRTDYTLTLLGKGPGLLSRLHKLVISTGPEPPSNIVFSKVTENSLTVSWTKPKSSVDGFKVTYTHAEDGEPVSVSVDSEESTLGLSQLSPGSTYEVTVISTLGLDESDPIKDFVTTLPDPPTDLRAVNVTDSTALLLWRPALAAIDKYAIVYGSGTGSELRVTVSGNAAEQQLSGLEGSTTYTVTITSQLGSQESSEATTSFTTSGGSGMDGDGPRDLQATNVSPRTAMLSWKPPSNPASSYRLTYQTEGQEMKEVIVDAMVTQVNLTRLHPGSTYTVRLQAETGGRYTSAISTEFTTGTLRFPFPTDCSQELLNGIYTSGVVEIFPRGKEGKPILVSCDMETDGGGWTVFQRRKDGSVDFFRKWKEYTAGFGDVSGEFWLGLDSLHNLTTMTRMILRVDLRDGDESAFAQYSTFEVAKRNYRLTVGGYSGTAGDSLSYHNNRIFSTRDRDPATFITRCAMSYRGGWWYKNCHEANLNGLYGIEVKHQGVIWTAWKGKEFSIPFTEMKMRPAAFTPPARG